MHLTPFSLSLSLLQLRVMSVGNRLLWVPCRSHFPSLSITHAYPHMFLTQKRHWTHHKRKQEIDLIGRLTESALAVGMLGHWSAGNEISQQELIDVCNAWQCFHLRLNQQKGGREHGAQKCQKGHRDERLTAFTNYYWPQNTTLDKCELPFWWFVLPVWNEQVFSIE